MNEKFNLPTPPYLGAAYYPEDWDESEADYDIKMMKEAGITVARMGEFAWKKMEPHPGEFNFEWLHKIVDKLGEAGIASVLGTPTATPPKWLSNICPDVTYVNASEQKASHGGRRHCCSNNSHYRQYSARIVEKMAKEFGDDPNVIGWQIDNEIYSFDICHCPVCTEKFRRALEEKYGDIDSLNRAWNLNLFSQAYESFDEIPTPRNAWHNPHLVLEWFTFAQNSHIDFVHMQADILHKYIKNGAPVGTDIMPVNGMDYRKLNSKLEVAQINHYHEINDLYSPMMWFDYLRQYGERPFWNTETQTSHNGSVSITQSVKPYGWCKVNTYLPLALGGEACMYWLWRTHWAGHEMAHGAVLDSSGRPMYPFEEIKETAALMKKTADVLNNTKVVSDVALHFTSRNWNMHLTQQMVHGADDGHITAFYRSLTEMGVRVDVIDAAEDVSKYKMIVSPLTMTLEEHGLPERMAEWVKNGGVWVVGPLSDIRSEIGTRYKDRPFGILEKLTGAKWLYGIADRERRVKSIDKETGERFDSTLWYDIYDEADENIIATVEGGNKTIDGKPCIISKKVGKGTVILLGTFPEASYVKKLYSRAMTEAGIPHGAAEGEIAVSTRRGEGREALILVEYAGKDGAYTLSRPMKNVITGEVLNGRVEMKPYDILVLE